MLRFILDKNTKNLPAKINSPFDLAPSKEVIRPQEGASRCLKGRTNKLVAPIATTTTQVRVKEYSCPNLEGQLSLLENLTNVRHLLRNIFQLRNQSNLFAGRIKRFLSNWERLTTDKEVLNIVKGWEIPLLAKPIQQREPHSIKMTVEETSTVDLEVNSMLGKGAIRLAIPKEDQILSNIFLRPKTTGGDRPILNLKELNQFVPYQHFKMEGLKDLKTMVQQGDLFCKIDLKDAYYTVPLSTKSRKYVRFKWRGNLYEFLCLAFGLGPAPRVFTKLLKIPIFILRRINIRLIIYLDDLLLMGETLQEIEMARDSTIFLFHHLGFVINLKKSVLTPQTRIEFLGIVIDSNAMTISLPEGKAQSLTKLCQHTLTLKQITLREPSSLIGKLRVTAPAILPAPLQLRYLQQLLIQKQHLYQCYESLVSLDKSCLMELKWWITNLNLSKGKPIHLEPPEMIIQSDAAKTGGWGATMGKTSTGGQWNKVESQLHINIQELIAAELP